MHRLRETHAAGEKITMLTCYEQTFARVLDRAGTDCLVVGDSLPLPLMGELEVPARHRWLNTAPAKRAA